MSPLVSVCIPVYNAAPFIKACVDSILAQTFQDFEIVMVNDGSTDDSLQVCRQLAEACPKITLVSTENQGDTRTRGEAAAHASGTWVTFVDSDDTLPPTALADLLGGCSEQTDIVVGCHYETAEPAHYVDIKKWRETLVRSDVIYCSPVARLFRKEVLPKSVFSLKTSVRTGTDMPMNIKIAFQSQKDVFLINKKVYNYYEHADSLSHSAVWSIQKISDLYEEVVDSVPAEKREAFMPQLIENRLIALENRYFADGWKEEPVQGTPYVGQLQQDIRESGYKLTAVQKRCAYRPDSNWTAFRVKFHHKAVIAKRIIRRKLHLGD